jgi:FAD-dependent halogenase
MDKKRVGKEGYFMKTEHFDTVVIGGGPGGSTAATFIAMQGHKVLLLEKQRLPAYKIGESLLPATVHGICVMLGVSEELKKANFVRKNGGTFRWGRSPVPWTFAFAQSSRISGPTSYAYQVERSKFDHILVENAIRKGVDVRQNHSVLELQQEGGRFVGIVYSDENGDTGLARARYIVDASGHQTPFARHVGERVYSKFFQNIAVFGYFLNGKRMPAPNEGNIFSVSFQDGWFWYIPLSDTLTSVGAVVAKENAAKFKNGHEAAFYGFIEACQPIKDLLASATRVTEGQYGEVRVRKDYSYCNTKFWAPGLVLVGDAACFIDPVFSSGVHLATYSAFLAARSINTCLEGGLDEVRCFEEFELRYRREFGRFYDFLIAFYDIDQDLDSYYWTARKVINSEEKGNEAFIQLVSGIGAGERLYSSSEDFMNARDGLGQTLFPESAGGEISMSIEDNLANSRRQEFMDDFLKEIVNLQTQATLKDTQRLQERTLFDNGLTPSPDGFHWAEPAKRRRR